MKIEDIVRTINNGEAEGQLKEAAAQPTKEASQGALASALAKMAGDTTKATLSPSPSGNDAVADLMKVASELAGAEKEAEATQAYICGGAFADGAIAKFAAYDAQVKEAAANEAVNLLREEQAKLAQLQQQGTPPIFDEMQKKAQEELAQDAIVKQAMDAGYSEALTLIAAHQEQQKVAADEQANMELAQEKAASAGYDAALQQTHDLAVGEFLKGAAAAEIMINKYKTQNQQAAQ